ncbi:DHHC palmitoyltransferase-domain-containing protein [Calycina marina]|uniref:Palmitoyltransferase n=1 Tax=Calycina marina TaxID=1763456 RepID=A0A9P8CB23_9HELO|nr:DHHC palmitoyltransferase-domain-containing protein [Calycina marina]
MGLIRNIAIVSLTISFITFVAFFGRLPALRNTPIGALNRVLWVHTPRGLQAVDARLTNGRTSALVVRLANHLWNDRHPIVMIFFILLLSVSEIMIVPQAWPELSTSYKAISTVLIILPYVFLYASAASDPGYISPENHSQHLSLYPYDFTIYHPGQPCRTCRLLKPARSKHCSICKRCISKMDHHCIFINNCVGYQNQHWFLLLLFATATVISYAVFIGSTFLSTMVKSNIPRWNILGKGFTWSEHVYILGWALQERTRMGAVTLLCALTAPLVWGLLGYHTYLVWAGTTTNESMKWSDWQAEMCDGFVFKRSLPKDRRKDPRNEPEWTSWPVESEQVVLRTDDGLPPAENFGMGEWVRVWKLTNIENLYDLGFKDNLKDVFWRRPRES